MRSTFFLNLPAPLIAFLVFLCILLLNWLGYRFKHYQLRKYPNAEMDNLGPIEGSLLGLMALLLAFSFGNSASKFEGHREIIVKETNSIATAIDRCDLYPDSVRNLLRANFTDYVAARVAYYEAKADEIQVAEALKKSQLTSKKIWEIVVEESKQPNALIRSNQMIPAVNSIIDIATTREGARIATVPAVILFMLIILIQTSAFLVGYSQKSKKRNLVMNYGFAVMISLAFYLVLELDRPRRGIINLDPIEQKMADLQNQLK
jgi:hypothetical protein